jgi:hypothetical protein
MPVVEARDRAPFRRQSCFQSVDGEEVYPVADALNRRGIPFVFSTAYGEEKLPVEYSDNRPLVDKALIP